MLQANANWWDQQLSRLENARQSANVTVDTDSLSLEQVVERIVAALGIGLAS
jgi:hypothetical protein